LPIGDDLHCFPVTFGYKVCRRNVSIARYWTHRRIGQAKSPASGIDASPEPSSAFCSAQAAAPAQFLLEFSHTMTGTPPCVIDAICAVIFADQAQLLIDKRGQA
jgi:hypothetical protein